MPRRLSPDLTLDGLKKEAKRWLKALHASDPDARGRFERALAGAASPPTLRTVQLALAREFGFSGWADLKQRLELRVPATRAAADAVTRFLDNACPDHHVRGGTDHVRAAHTAMRLLERDPAIARANFYTAVVCGDLGAVTRALADDPGWATRRNGDPDTERTDAGGENDLVKRDWGAKGWEPLSYLCFTRLPLKSVADNAVAIATALLDHGANPNAYFMAGSSQYTPLVGVIGEGEEGRPGHPRRDALVGLLLDRGAEPYDMQVGYNIHFNGRALWFLQTIYAHCLRIGRAKDWEDPEWMMLNEGGYGSGARWYLDIAVEHDDVELAEWCLAHHANPNAAPGPGRRNRQRSLYDEAIYRGHMNVADVLARYGAAHSPLVLTPLQSLVAACLRSDLDAVRAYIAAHPEFVSAPEPLFACAEYNRRESAQLLLDLGTSPDIESRDGERALHQAAYKDSVDVAELLIARGADVDPIGRPYGNTPLGGAMHCQARRLIDLLSRYSQSAWEVGYAGNVDRLREVLREKPERARGYDGETLLMYLPPDDEATAIKVALLLLEHGADPAIKDPQGMTAADRAERNAMFEVAKLLRTRAGDSGTAKTLDDYDAMARTLLDAYVTGTPEAMERLYHFTWHRRPWQAMRTYVQLDLGKHPNTPGDDVPITIEDARYLIAREHGFEDWASLAAFLSATPAGVTLTTKPVRVRSAADRLSKGVRLRDWQAVLRELASTPAASLDAEGSMTDDMLRDVARIATLTSLNLSGSHGVTDTGLASLAGAPSLRRLDLSSTSITDHGLTVVRELPQLESLSLAMTRVTDAGMPVLAVCHALSHVNVMGTPIGDAAIRALAGNANLRRFESGHGVTDEGLAMLHDLPVFKSWQGGEVEMALLSYDTSPNKLLLRGPFTDRGMQHLRGLDGLFGLNLDASELAITAAALEPLVSLPHLGWLAVDAKDDWMPLIAAMPRLQFLGAQDTAAGDDGFVALSRSRSIEYIWGRRCHNLRDRGFAALANLPALRGLSVSCLNVSDAAIAVLPRFPALRELMPMDIPDAGYRHIAQCRDLESLVLMYCRDTTDAATEHLGGLSKLSYYFNSYTTITDRTPEILSTMDSLERITFDACHRLTNAGIVKLAGLPRLRELRVSARQVTAEVRAAFPASVSVDVD